MSEERAEKPKKGVNKPLLLVTILFGIVLVGPIALKIRSSQPDLKVEKVKITEEQVDEFAAEVQKMVDAYTVRVDNGLPVVHPPAGSDVYLLARNYDWGDFVLELEKDKVYRLKLTTRDFKHAIVVHALRLQNRIKPGEIKTIEFAPHKSGTFEIVCGEFCGPGHGRMVGKLIVVE